MTAQSASSMRSSLFASTMPTRRSVCAGNSASGIALWSRGPTIATASGPLTRITPMALSPIAVAMAAIVSSARGGSGSAGVFGLARRAAARGPVHALHRQAPAHRIHAMLLVEGERLALECLGVLLILAAERVHLRLKRLHRLHRPHALDGEWVEQHLRHDREQDDRDAVVADVLVRPVHQQQDRYAEPLHRQPAPFSRQRKPTEVDRALDAQGLAPLVLLRSCVERDVALPRLAGRYCRRGPHGNGRAARWSLVAVLGVSHLALGSDHELEPRALRDQCSQIPDAVQGDPIAVDNAAGRGSQVINSID